MTVFLPTVFPAAGHRNSPVPMEDGPGVFHLPGSLPDGSRLMFAYDDRGVIVEAAVVEPGGDIDAATSYLDAACSRSERPA